MPPGAVTLPPSVALVEVIAVLVGLVIVGAASGVENVETGEV